MMATTTSSSTIYRYADKALKRLYRFVEASFQQLATTVNWDEISVITSVKGIYSDTEQLAEREYLEIARKAYAEASKEILELYPDRKDRFLEPTALFIAALLTGYNDKTQYVYDREVERKEARLSESLISINDNAALFNSNATREALRRAIRLYERQLRNMADTVTDESRNQAFDDAGIDRVKWITQKDGKVCPECRERDEQVFMLYSVPAKHANCRCYTIPIKSPEQ